MCRETTHAARRSPRLLLTSVESFSQDAKAGPPRPMEMFTTGLFVFFMLIFIEYNLKQLLEYFQVREITFEQVPMAWQSIRGL